MPWRLQPRLGTLILCGALAILAVAGCGGGTTTTSTTAAGTAGAAGASNSGTSSGAPASSTATGSAPLTHQQFVAKANAICAHVNAQARTLPAITDMSSFGAWAAGVQPLAKDAAGNLEQLQPPAEDQASFNTMVGKLREQIAIYPRMQAAAEAGDKQDARTALNDLQTANSALDAAALDIGLTDCAKEVTPQG